MSAKLICSLQNKSFLFCLVLTCSLQTRPTDCKLQVPIQLEFSMIPSHFPTAVALAISEECVNHTKDYVEALRNQSPWAVQMYESSGRLEQDLLYTGSGNIHHQLGLFDVCLSITDGVSFQGKYCTVFFDFKPAPFSASRESEPYEYMSNFRMPSVSFCIPSTCSARDLRSAVAQLLNGHRVIKGENFSLVAITNENYCYTQGSEMKFDILFTSTLALFCLLGLFIIAATVHECFWGGSSVKQLVDSRREKTFSIRLLHGFSAIQNCRELLSTKNEEDSLSCLYGIRVLTTCWIVFQHTFSDMIGRNSYNTETILKRIESSGSTMNFTIAVDTFFLMSGLLATLSQMRRLITNQGAFNLGRFYLHRYFRLTPLYAAVLAFAATLYPHVGTGPDWSYVERISQAIRKYWWNYLLYTHNDYMAQSGTHLLNNPMAGMGETWSLVCDMQMFWISPLFIYPLWRWKKAGLIWTIFSLLIFLGISVAIFIVNEIPSTFVLSGPTEMKTENDKYFQLYYIKTYARIPPYLIGIILGWLIHNTRSTKIQMEKNIVRTCWAVSVLFWVIAVYGLPASSFNENEVTIIDSFFRVSYGALHRSAWAVAIGWLIFACIHDYGGYVNHVLSWKLFVPLSRLCYAVFLIHPLYIKAYNSHQRKPVYITESYFITTYLGILTAVFTLASAASVCIEMPFLKLNSLLTQHYTSDKKISYRGNRKKLS